MFILWLQPNSSFSHFNKSQMIDALPTVGGSAHCWGPRPPMTRSQVTGEQKGMYKLSLSFRTCPKSGLILFSSFSMLWLFLRKKEISGDRDIDGLDKGCQQLYSLLNAMSPEYLVITHIAFVPLAESGTFPQGLIPCLCGMQMNDACSWICAAKFSSQLQQLLEGREPWLLFITILGH